MTKSWNPHLSQIEEIEQLIIEKYVTKSFVEKEWLKILNDLNNVSDQKTLIPQLLSNVYYELVNEKIWNIIVEYKYPTIDFSYLLASCNDKVKFLMSELF